jgi:carboxymethylenebutenolidase
MAPAGLGKTWIMNRIALSLALLASTLSAQDWARAKVEASPRHREWITVKHDGRNVESFVVYPESKNKTPVVIVIHEIFGHSDWVQELADELAEAGYIAVAPDLLSGMGPNGGRTTSIPSNQVGEAIGKLPPDQITADLSAVADYAKKIPAGNGKLYVAGFCWGGGQSFRFATNRPDLDGAFVFYGPPPAKDAMAKIKAPVYGFYGGNDARIDATIPDTTAAMKAAGKTYEPVTYEGAGHGFMRAGDSPPPAADATENAKKAYEANHRARNEAWARWKKLMGS